MYIAIIIFFVAVAIVAFTLAFSDGNHRQKAQTTDYEFETEYWADQPTYKVILFALSMIIAFTICWLINLFERTLQIRP
jgi:hypothetical protein